MASASDARNDSVPDKVEVRANIYYGYCAPLLPENTVIYCVYNYFFIVFCTILVQMTGTAEPATELSKTIIVRWEEANTSVSDKSHKKQVLQNLLTMCGLGTSFNVTRMRTLLVSLKRTSLLACASEVDSMLTTYGDAISGTLV